MADNVDIQTPSGVVSVSTKQIAGGAQVQRNSVQVWDAGGAVFHDVVGTANGSMRVEESGTYAYRAGTSATTIDVPSGALLKRVSVLAGSGGSATITIGGGNTITVPAGGSFDETIPGNAVGADVVMGGTVAGYYVAWTA